MPPFILAVDLGTTSTKAMAVTADGKVLTSHAIPNLTNYPQPGYTEQNPDKILQAVRDCIRLTLEECPAQDLICLSFSAAMHSLMAVDQAGIPLSGLIIWSDMRSTAQAYDLIHRGVAYPIYEATGTAIHPMSPLCKLMWWKLHRPDLILKAHKFLSIKDYVLYHLTNEWLTDYSIASATGLFNIRTLAWDSSALREAGISEHQLPTPVPTTRIMEVIKSDSFAGTPLPRQFKVIPGASDGCLANLGTDVIHPGELSITIGTSGAVRMMTREPKPDLQQRIFNYILSDQRMIVGGATNNGAVLLEWFESVFGKSVAGISMYEEVDNACRLIPQVDGPIFLPYVLGERAPIYDPHARGVFFGMGMQHQRTHLLKGMMEGICFSLLSIARCVEETVGGYHIIVASGGFIHSPGWVQLLSDIFNKEVKVVAQEDASAMGAARLGFEALGIAENFFTNENESVSYHPRATNHELYQKKFEIFLSLYRNLKQDFYNLSNLRENDNAN